MNHQDFTTSIVVNKTAQEVYAAINNPRAWWQGTITGSTDILNEAFVYEMQPYHLSTQKIITLVPDKKVVWLVTESQINFVADKGEWLHTNIIFDITKEGEQTKISFTHQGLVPKIECYDNCSGAWESLIERSLFSYITTGKGVDVF